MPRAQIPFSLHCASIAPHAASGQHLEIRPFVTWSIGACKFLIQTIAESLAEHGGHSQEPDVPSASVWVAQKSSISIKINKIASKSSVNGLGLLLEQLLHYTLQASECSALGLIKNSVKNEFRNEKKTLY